LIVTCTSPAAAASQCPSQLVGFIDRCQQAWTRAAAELIDQISAALLLLLLLLSRASPDVHFVDYTALQCTAVVISCPGCGN